MIRNILTTTFTVLKILVCGVVECLGSLPEKCENLRKAAEKIEAEAKLHNARLKERSNDQTSN